MQTGQAAKSPLPCSSRLDAQSAARPVLEPAVPQGWDIRTSRSSWGLGLGGDHHHSVHGQQGWVEAHCLERSAPYALSLPPSWGLGHTGHYRPIFHPLLSPTWEQPSPLAGPVDSQGQEGFAVSCLGLSLLIHYPTEGLPPPSSQSSRARGLRHPQRSLEGYFPAKLQAIQ